MRNFARYEDLLDYCTVTTDRLSSAMFGENGYVEGLIALDGAKPVGYALFYPCFASFRGERGMYLEDIYSVAASLAGICGISVPCGETEDALPIGVQIMGRHFDEKTMLRVAKAVEDGQRS